jgi:O-antigen/teichoic acid export membrane protein
LSIISFLTKKFKLSSKKEKVAKNVYWAILGKSLNLISGIFVGILVARFLGPEKYGLMNYVITYVSLFSILSNFGLDNIEIRELAKEEEKRNVIIGSTLVVRLLLSLLTILIIFITLVIFESDRQTIFLILLYSCSLMFNSFNVVRNYFTSIVMNEYVIKTEIVRTFFSAILKISLLFLKAKLFYFILILTFDFALLAAGYTYSYRKKIGDIKQWQFDINIAKQLLKYSFPLLFSGSAIIMYQKVDQILIRNMMDNVSLGYFSVAVRLTEVTLFIPMIISQTIGPLLVKLRQEKPEEYLKKRQSFVTLLFWVSLSITIGMILCSKMLVLMLYGQEYEPAISVLKVLAIKITFLGIFNCSTQLIIIENLQKYAVIRNLMGLVVSLALNFLLIPHFGIMGAAIATVAANVFSSYIAHGIIKPFRFIFLLQNNAILQIKRLPMIISNLKK